MATTKTKPRVGQTVHYVPTLAEEGAGCSAALVTRVLKDVKDTKDDETVIVDNETLDSVALAWWSTTSNRQYVAAGAERSEVHHKGTWHPVEGCDQ